MCGIGGVVRWRGEVDTAARWLDAALAHRGPDGAGHHREDGIALVHRRLAIIDLAGGVQPLTSEDGGLVLVCNGEIYNFRELRRELEARGHRFATGSDCEVIVHLWEEEGEACLPRLNGMFAFALLERASGTLWLARDRMGIKPLYYHDGGGGAVAFASELPALAGLPGLAERLELDLDALWHFLALLYVPSPRTAYRQIRALAPGHVARCGADGVRERSYWRPPAATDAGTGLAEAAEELGAAVDAAVARQMVSEVPLGAYLSGGVDSSMVVSAMARASAEPVRTFSVQVRDPEYDETAYAAQVVERFGTDHHWVPLSAFDLEMTAGLQRYFGQPFADPSMLPTFLVSRAIRDKVTVALGGDGPDELMAGYDKYRPLVGRSVDEVGREALAGLFFRVPESLRRRVFRPSFAAARADTWEELASGLPRRPGRAVDYMRQMDVRYFMEGDILAKVDRMSMAHALEARVPLLDNAVVDLALAMPERLIIDDCGTGKLALKEALAARMPRAFAFRQKIGFTLPVHSWLVAAAPELFRELEGSRALADLGLLAQDGLPYLRQAFDAGLPKADNLLLALVMLDRWLILGRGTKCT